MRTTSYQKNPSLQLKRITFVLATAWTVVIVLICAWHLREQHTNAQAIAYNQAAYALEKDMVYRLWAAKYGGVYVPVSEETQPNPYLKDVPHRDVTTTDGQQLTLINPAYMTRQVHEMERERYALRGHLTSLDPIRPENAPDAWEAEALRTLELGVPEVSAVTRIEDAEYLRLIRPMLIEETCLKCHATQGYSLGGLRGGISMAVPLEPLYAMTNKHMINTILGYALIWLIGVIGAGRAVWHITQRVRKREQVAELLRENEKSLRLTLSSIGDGIITTDLTGKITQVNPVAEKLTGWRSKDAHGRPLTEVFNVIHPQSRQTLANPTGQFLATDARSGMARDAILTATCGTEYRIAYNASPIMDIDGHISGMVLVFEDMTKQIRLQEELLKARKLESIAILAGGLAHDFNNLFTGLFGNIQLAMMKLGKDHPAYPRLVTASQSFVVGTNLTQQLLTFAKGGQPLLEETDLGQVIQDSLQFNIKQENIKVVQSLPQDLWRVNGDHGQLCQVFGNLFLNSVQAMPEGGTLYIDAQNIEDIRLISAPELSGAFVKTCIRDEGSGIPADEVPKVFDIFYTTKDGGRGLGLAVVHRIVAKHNGHICFTSIPDVGTTVTIYLPAEASSLPTSAAIPADRPGKPGAATAHILVMDDDEIIRDLAREMLETCGYQVDTATGGQEALEKYAAADNSGKPFDVVIMDLNIPGGMGGKIAIKKLLALDPGAKVIVTSGYFSDAVLADFLVYGFKGRLAKPFKTEALQNELSRVINLQ
jgi:PAS domain S-box-containing protein